jgi:hypothetical protein
VLLTLADTHGQSESGLSALQTADAQAGDTSVPTELRCALTNNVLRHPVIASDGYTYERVTAPTNPNAHASSSARLASACCAPHMRAARFPHF